MFTEAVIEMPGSQVWAVLFFVMLFSLGLSSMFGNVEGVLSPFKDLDILPKWIPDQILTGKGQSRQRFLRSQSISPLKPPTEGLFIPSSPQPPSAWCPSWRRSSSPWVLGTTGWRSLTATWALCLCSSLHCLRLSESFISME